jgi:hypothetical protein
VRPRATLISLALFLLFARPVLGQDLRTRISRQLFTFGSCGQPLCLVALSYIHGLHFIPADTASGASILSFMANSIGASVANTPVTSASSGVTFQFVGGLPVKTSTSAGPIFGERAQTLGRGRFYVGANVSQMHFERLRGIRVDDLRFNFTHQDIGVPGLGNEIFENDVVQVNVSLNVNLLITSLVMSYGIVDGVDVSVDVPLVRTSVEGHSVANILPLGGFPTPHFFAGDATNPVLTAYAATSGAATGLGDVAARVKVNIAQTKQVGVALLVDARFATGDETNLLGSGAFAGRGLGVVSATWGNTTPHFNLGYVFRDGTLQNNSVVATLGFDQLLAPFATMAFDVLSDWQIGDSKLVVPGPVQYIAPYPHQVIPTNIPGQGDDLMAASLGFKFATQRGILLVTNALIPLRNSGLQPNVVWTGGIEYNF